MRSSWARCRRTSIPSRSPASAAAGRGDGQSTQGVRLRAAEASDVPAIVGLIRELADFEKLTHLVEVTPQSLLRQLFGARPAAEAVVAERAGQLIGFALFFSNFDLPRRPGLYLEDLYVQPAHRGGGVGKALLTHLAGLANQRGCGRFEWSVLDWNVDAIRFYERMGAPDVAARMANLPRQRRGAARLRQLLAPREAPRLCRGGSRSLRSSRQGCQSWEVEVPFRQLPGLDG